METVKTITLEDGLDYIVTDEIIVNDVKYIYLTCEEDMEKFCIRKLKKEDNEEYLVVLNSDEEFENAMKEYLQKHRS